jgi:hypothetical protein
MKAAMLDVVGEIMAYEHGESGRDRTLALFAHLIRTGMAWKLQGSYGRQAQHIAALLS